GGGGAEQPEPVRLRPRVRGGGEQPERRRTGPAGRAAERPGRQGPDPEAGRKAGQELQELPRRGEQALDGGPGMTRRGTRPCALLRTSEPTSVSATTFVGSHGVCPMFPTSCAFPP